eukprot:TRINITY_DN33331_c0_g1_i1.p1 TRINITY_DN33331_c0_g1~~TRINITY_DN33331_c0_g1_i1.p1  ORF type:complete len:534 (-),score=31.61 TRINITY_DN33331_c0_g1_i1:46-1647(-)
MEEESTFKRLKVVIDPSDGGFFREVNSKLVITLGRHGMDKSKFYLAIHQRLLDADLLGEEHAIKLQYLLPSVGKYVLLDDTAFAILMEDDAPCIISAKLDVVKPNLSSKGKLRSGPIKTTFTDYDKGRKRRQSSALPDTIMEHHLFAAKPSKPNKKLFQPKGRSHFSNAPTLGQRPLDNEGDIATEEDPRWWKIWTRLYFGSHQYFFWFAGSLTNYSFLDILFICGSVLACWLSQFTDYKVDFSPSLLIAVVVFPLSFSVNSAYSRRESALADLASIKGAALSLFLMSKEWTINVPQLGLPCLIKIGDCLMQLFVLIRLYLTCKYEPYKEYYLQGVYSSFSDIVAVEEHVREGEVHSALFTRLIYDIQTIIVGFERLRLVADYRTPSSIRAFTRFSIVLLSYLFSPYFAYLGLEYQRSLGYVLAVALPVMFISLENVQTQLENPFGSDDDDINLDYLRCIDTITHLTTQLKTKKWNEAYNAQSEPTKLTELLVDGGEQPSGGANNTASSSENGSSEPEYWPCDEGCLIGKTEL